MIRTETSNTGWFWPGSAVKRPRLGSTPLEIKIPDQESGRLPERHGEGPRFAGSQTDVRKRHRSFLRKSRNPVRDAFRQGRLAAESLGLMGFTLVEMLVVIAIIALLLSILLPSLRKVKSMAMRLKCAHNLKQINLAVNFYLNENDNTYPCAQDPLPAGYWLWMGRGWRFLVEPYLGGNIDANNPSVLFCPQDHVSKDKYESTSYAYSMAFYHSPEQIDDMNSPADTYGNPQPSIPQRSMDVSRPSGKILIGEWLSNHLPIDDDQGWWCWQGRRNYLFVDGQVRLLDAKQIRPARDGLPNANLTIHGIKGLDYSP